jgi:hypothetical protein
MLVFCVRKCFKLLFKERFEINEDIEAPDKLISSKFEEGSTFLDSDGMLILKRLYVTHCRQLRKELFNYLEESMPHDCLIGCKISTISKKDATCVCKISPTIF